MADCSQSQVEQIGHQQKWRKFADELRNSVGSKAPNNQSTQQHQQILLNGDINEMPAFEKSSIFPTNGLKTQSSTFENDPTHSVECNGLDCNRNDTLIEDGFEIVSHKRNRSQRFKSTMDNLNHTDEMNLTTNAVEIIPDPSLTLNHNKPLQNRLISREQIHTADKLSINNDHESSKNTTWTNKNENTAGLLEEPTETTEHEASNHSSDSAFAENQSPSHGSSTSLHLICDSENHEFSDSVVALSDEEKWPELGVAIKNDNTTTKLAPSPTSSTSTQTKTTISHTKITANVNATYAQNTANIRRGSKPQWKKVDIDIMYNNPHEQKNHANKKDFQLHNEVEGGLRRQSGSFSANKRRSVRRRYRNSYDETATSSSRSVEQSVEPSTKSINNKDVDDDSCRSSKLDFRSKNQHYNQSTQQISTESDAQLLPSTNSRRELSSRQSENGRTPRNLINNHTNYRNYNDGPRRGPRHNNNTQRPPRYNAPNLFRAQGTIPLYFLNQDYAVDMYGQPVQANTHVFYPNMANMFVPTFTDVNYAPYVGAADYIQPNFYAYQNPAVMSVPFFNADNQQPTPLSAATVAVSTTVATPSSSMVNVENFVNETLSVGNNSTSVVPTRNYADELSALLQRVFHKDNPAQKSLRDLTMNPAIVEKLNINERKLVLINQTNFYFSLDNLAKDIFLRKNMDAEAFVPITLLMTFPRIKHLALDMDTVMETLLNTNLYEVRFMEKEPYIRSKETHVEWVTKNLVSNTVTTNAQHPNKNTFPSTSMVMGSRQRHTAPNDISVDDVRQRLTQARLKQNTTSQISKTNNVTHESR